ncbi:MAG: carbamoyltransferase HypF [Woeseiaceae bacterium]
MASARADVIRPKHESVKSVRITLSGHVQGVGFRPFVYRIAALHELQGQVQNKLGEVEIIATGARRTLAKFEKDLVTKAPPLSRPVIDSIVPVDRIPFSEFSIIESSQKATAKVFVPPDFYMCDDCRHELEDAADRRYRYPFINCTQCGPRYTLIEKLPYDRANTSMQGFSLCDACLGEYENPADRRFHAEPVACPSCGPHVSFHSPEIAVTESAALDAVVESLQAGDIVAVKGIGGYHLLCDARSSSAVAKLRTKKNRPHKPLAVMFPTAGQDDLDFVRESVSLTNEESMLLVGPVRPIVLATKKQETGLAANLAPGLRELGVFLPYSPLHQLLLTAFGGPLVATSGNISGEPVLTDNAEVEARLSGVADAFLHHNRPIVRPADDPVFRRVAGNMRPLRIGRGAGPCELELPWHQQKPVLGVGGHMKATVTLSWGNRAVVSPHIGEMDSPRSLAVFEQVLTDLQTLYGVQAGRIVCDAHPGYATSRWARSQKLLPVSEVWHHRAHASAVAAEFNCDGQWLVFTWDGVGLGEDKTLWGGEALLGETGNWKRVCSMRRFHLPGGERAGREPWRSAAALSWAAGRTWADSLDVDGLAFAAWRQQLNCPETTAVGRIFDAASALICGVRRVSFEAQGPMILESLCDGAGEAIALPLKMDADGILRSDWEPLLNNMMDESQSREQRSATFHSSMAAALCAQACAVRDETRVDQVGLAGGVFQNRLLTDQVVSLLKATGFQVHVNRKLPCNDAALSFGQVAEFAASEAREKM